MKVQTLHLNMLHFICDIIFLSTKDLYIHKEKNINSKEIFFVESGFSQQDFFI